MFTTNPDLLKQLLNDVADGKIQLPDFQRGWVWDDGRIKELLVSISRGFPVGADYDSQGRRRYSVPDASD